MESYSKGKRRTIFFHTLRVLEDETFGSDDTSWVVSTVPSYQMTSQKMIWLPLNDTTECETLYKNRSKSSPVTTDNDFYFILLGFYFYMETVLVLRSPRLTIFINGSTSL